MSTAAFQFCGGGGCLVVGGSCVCGDCWGLSTGGGFQSMYDDLAP